MRHAWAVITMMMLLGSTVSAAQSPEIFDVADVVAGAQRLDTRYAFAMGKWSDAGEDVGLHSTQIHCYKRFGLCEAASAFSLGGKAYVNFDSFDILRWDTREIIAVDSSAMCVVNTLRFDLNLKKVSLTSTPKPATQIKACDNLGAKTQTVFLTGR